MKEEYKKWYSPNLSGEIELLIFGHSGCPILLFPTSKGRYYETKDFGLIGSVQHLIEEGKVKIYCPDSIDAQSWYNKSIPPADRAKNQSWYDKMLVEELFPLACNETGYGKVVTAGCSFGGYHAANFAFKHPVLVSHLFSMSGTFDITPQTDGFYNSDIYYNNPVDFLPGDNDPDLWKMDIVLGTGDWDICRPFNERLSGILQRKNINHWLDIKPGADHDWPVWRNMFPEYLSRI
ncbi:esterase family protein [Pedobacter cryoconitis]|uniref:Esterase/lipase superfamily enzyme n=1 Tax=Pedobacter cryoconitis TaxID=188932 RepID=A0A7X0J7Y8_9SPHI|nr:alpha/beta hydrolase-fold protein [Pedobacter cryoconitis]MBB6502314.1 esterase/lipase superfamily enzyme [Pedobacter cryoconitis]